MLEVQRKKMKKVKIMKKIFVVLLWIVCLYGSYHAYLLYDYDKEHPQKEYKTGIDGKLPDEAVVKIDMYNYVKNIILIGLGFVVIYFVLDYKDDPKRHFITLIVNKFEKYTKEDEK